MEENPEVMNLIMQRLNSENQENGGKRNGIEKDEEWIKKTHKKQFQPLTEEQNSSKKWEIKRYKDLTSL